MQNAANLQNLLKRKTVSEMTLSEFITSLSPTTYYPCNDTSGTALTDSISSNNATLTNPSRMTLGDTGLVGNNCITFNGGGAVAFFDYPAAGIFPVLGNTAFTISMFIKCTAGNAGTVFQEGKTDGSAYLWVYGISYSAPNRNIQFKVRSDAGATLEDSTSSFTVTDATWTHLVIRDNNGTVDIFKNGVKSVTDHNYTRAAITSQDAYTGQRLNGAVAFLGSLQDISFFSSAVSDTNILTMAQKAGLA